MMRLRDLLQGCFGLKKKHSEKTFFIIDGTSPNGYATPPKSPETFIKSQNSFDSSHSFPAEAYPKSPIKALCVVSKGTYKVITDIAYPSIESPDEIIIQTKAVGLNPIDWKAVDYNFCMPSFPWINGRELAGTIVQIGSNVKDFRVGDDVWASMFPYHRS
jgi:hypothetical protein